MLTIRESLVFKYLNKTKDKDLCMVLAPSCIDDIDVFADAFYGTPRWQEPY